MLPENKSFYNPYNFIPTPSRDIKDADFGDQPALAHGAYHGRHWSGKIHVTLKVETPLLLLDAQHRSTKELSKDKEHFSYPIRQLNGLPYLSPTGVKGMLRSAYEAITNSRMSIFDDHKDRLAFRLPAKDGLQMVPARIEINESGTAIVHLLPGFSDITALSNNNDGQPNPPSAPRGSKPISTMYAAWLSAYDKMPRIITPHTGYHPEPGKRIWVTINSANRVTKIDDSKPTTTPSGMDVLQGYLFRIDNNPKELNFIEENPNLSSLTHGQYVYAVAKEILHRSGNFKFWKIQPGTISAVKIAEVPPGMQQIEGYLYISNKNIDGKHDEKIFFVDSSHSQKRLLNITLTSDEMKVLSAQWKSLINDYKQQHHTEMKAPGPSALQYSIWSRHITTPNSENLVNNTLCYARVQFTNERFHIQALYPVQISRDVAPQSPRELVVKNQQDHIPATVYNDLSPADRVFGWVGEKNGNKRVAYRGNLRIGYIECQPHSKPIEPLKDVKNKEDYGMLLSILAQPKPAQARFYMAKDAQGTSIPAGNTSRREAAEQGKYLHGRKVYPHHKGRGGIDKLNYWKGTSNETHFHRSNDYSDQNRSIQGWVNPGVTFEFDIHVSNLSDIELGALLWLLERPDDQFHRLGGGKPLGFGSVRLAVDYQQSELCKGDELKNYYQSLSGTLTKCEVDLIKSTKTDFDTKARQLFPKVLESFEKAAKGFDGKRTHYPRLERDRGDIFEWFGFNENGGKIRNDDKVHSPNMRGTYNNPKRLSLKSLTETEPAMPLLPASLQPPNNNQGGGNRRNR